MDNLIEYCKSMQVSHYVAVHFYNSTKTNIAKLTSLCLMRVQNMCHQTFSSAFDCFLPLQFSQGGNPYLVGALALFVEITSSLFSDLECSLPSLFSLSCSSSFTAKILAFVAYSQPAFLPQISIFLRSIQSLCVSDLSFDSQLFSPFLAA